MNKASGHSIHVLEPLLARVQLLDKARSSDQGQAAAFRTEVLIDLNLLISAFQVTLAADGLDEGAPTAGQEPALLCANATHPTAGADEESKSAVIVDDNPSGELPDRDAAAGCGELIRLLDEVAIAALISRSSLGTPAASRLRRETPPDRIAEILRRRDRLTTPDGQPDQEIPRLLAAPALNEAQTPQGVTCADALALAHEYQNGELSEDDWGKVRQHLEDCGSCLREYGLTAAVRRLVKKHCGCDPAPEGLQAKVSARIREVTRPDPLVARTPAEFIAMLREFRNWAGSPSLRELEQRSGLSKTAIHALLTGQVRQPRLEALLAIVAACGGTEEDKARWTAAWRQATAASRHERRSGLHQHAPHDAPGAPAVPAADSLTHQELEIARLAADDPSAIAIADQPGIGADELPTPSAKLIIIMELAPLIWAQRQQRRAARRAGSAAGAADEPERRRSALPEIRPLPESG